MAFKSIQELKDNNIIYAKHQTVLCTTNCVGTMGAGLALEIAQTFPRAHQEYMRIFKSGQMKTDTLVNVECDWHHVLLFPTKDDWRDPSPLELVLGNIEKLKRVYKDLKITSLAMPPLGVGLGKLTGDDAIAMLKGLKDLMDTIEIPVDCYLPDDLIDVAQTL